MVYFIITSLIVFVIVCAILKFFIPLFIGIILLCVVSASFVKKEHFTYYKFDDSKLDTLRKRIEPIIPEINKIQLHGSNKSFTIDKQTTYICTKNDRDEYYSDNMLIYVILHELAHALCVDKKCFKDEHGDAWEATFDSLLARAEKGGIYDSKIPILKDYCGY